MNLNYNFETLIPYGSKLLLALIFLIIGLKVINIITASFSKNW